MIKIQNNYIFLNPPYKELGVRIIDNVRKTINFKEFIAFLPLRDYSLCDDIELFNYTYDIEQVDTDYSYITHCNTYCAFINKNKINNQTIADFEISQYTDQDLIKYFRELRQRSHYAITDRTDILSPHYSNITSFVYSRNDFLYGHFPYSKKSITYRINTTDEEMSTLAIKESDAEFACITFKNEQEKKNFTNFIYSDDGFRFMSKVLTALNVSSRFEYRPALAFPKVDWTREWTVEEILLDYGYTDIEIQNIKNDLKHFRGLQ